MTLGVIANDGLDKAIERADTGIIPQWPVPSRTPPYTYKKND
jgi:hypothetical protein